MIYLLSPWPKEGCIHLPMIHFDIIEKTLHLQKYHLLMFTSKQAVLSIEALNPKWKEIPCLAIGLATARQIKALGGIVSHQAQSFDAKTLAKDIIKNFKEKKILYLRPKKVSFASKSFLSANGIEIDEEIIYKTSCMRYASEQKPVKDAIIIFTSPSTIHCFLDNFLWDTSYIAVIIGKESKVHLPPQARYEIADTPLIDACIMKAKEILISSNSK